MFKVLPISSDTQPQPSMPVVDRLVDNALLETRPCAIRHCFRSSTSNTGMRYTCSCNTPDLVVRRIQVRAVQWPQVWGSEMRCCVRCTVRQCAILLNVSGGQCYGWPAAAALTARRHGSRHCRLWRLSTQTPGHDAASETVSDLIDVMKVIQQCSSWSPSTSCIILFGSCTHSCFELTDGATVKIL